MDQERGRIQDDLRGLLQGDVRCDDLFLQLYASDASIYEIKPLAVVRPRTTRDVVTCVQYAAENQIPIQPRGAGTGLAGESLGAGIVMDFSRYMHRIGLVDDESVQVQPGVVHAVLNRQLARVGRTFGPDPAMSIVTTMGSVIAIDAAGSRWLKYGSARRHVISLQLVLADGSLIDVRNEPILRNDDPQPRRRGLVNSVARVIDRDADLIRTARPASPVNRCGYQLDDLVADEHLHMARLLVGSEGTLGIITEARLATQPLPKHRGVVLLMFETLESAAQAVTTVLREEPTACDLMDRRHLSLAREKDVRFDVLIPAETEAVLLLEFEAEAAQDLKHRVQRLAERASGRKGLALGARIALDREDVEFYWQLARRVVPTLHSLKGSSRALPFVEDIAVPPEQLADFLSRLFNVLKRNHLTASVFGHAGQGQLHIRPFLNLADRHDVQRMERLAGELYEEVWKVDGTISGEHGDGLSRSQFVARQYGPLYETFRDIKNIFDPHHLFNPGKIIATRHDALTQNLRPVSAETPKADPEAGDGAAQPMLGPVQLQLNWDQQQIVYAARSCNGCGACRSQLPDVRMCPIFRLAPGEEASPRAKANLVRAVLTGRLEPDTVTTEEFKKVADLCVNCHQCRLDCPANVDIPKLMVEAKAAYVAVNGLRPTDWFMTRLDWFCAMGSLMSPLSNWAIGSRTARWAMEKIFGVAQGRKLPRFARHTFLRQAARRRLTRPRRESERRVLYFVDVFANYHDTALAEAFIAVMEHNGVSVYVHPKQGPSGMAMISYGVVDKARRLAARNVALLADAVRQGYHIVATEPAAASCLVHEYPNLLDDDDVRLVAENTSEACSYLWKLHQSGKLRLDLQPVNTVLAYHQPCHLRSLGVGAPGDNLLRLIPGVKVVREENGCSGMAGTYGLKRENYRGSLRAGLELISRLREPQYKAGTTECSSCRMQMEQGTTKPTVHPLKILALAYRLTPPEANPLTARARLDPFRRLKATPPSDPLITMNNPG